MFTQISDLEKLANLIDAVNAAVYDAQSRKREDDARGAYDRQLGIWGRITASDYPQCLYQLNCRTREELFRQLPDTNSVSVGIAWYLVSDSQSFQAAMSSINDKFNDHLARNLMGMTIDAIRLPSNPAKILSLGWKAVSNIRAMFTHMDSSDAASGKRDRIAASILWAYKLTEQSPGSYALIRGKWGVETMYGQYARVHEVVMTENEVDPCLNMTALVNRLDR